MLPLPCRLRSFERHNLIGGYAPAWPGRSPSPFAYLVRLPSLHSASLHTNTVDIDNLVSGQELSVATQLLVDTMVRTVSVDGMGSANLSRNADIPRLFPLD